MTHGFYDGRITVLREAHDRTVAAAQKAASACHTLRMAMIDEVVAIIEGRLIDPSRMEALRITAFRASSLHQALAAFEDQTRDALVREVLEARGLIEKVTP